jgi:hypothetical protein
VWDANLKVIRFYWLLQANVSKPRPEFFALQVKSTQGSWLDKNIKLTTTTNTKKGNTTLGLS